MACRKPPSRNGWCSHEQAGVPRAAIDRRLRRMAWARKRPVIRAGRWRIFSTLHRDAIEQHAAGVRDGCGRHLAGIGDAIDLRQWPPGQRNLPGLPQRRRQRLVLSQRPALSAIPQGQTGRLEGRLGPQLDVAIAAAGGMRLVYKPFSRMISRRPSLQTININTQQMDDPWEKTSN